MIIVMHETKEINVYLHIEMTLILFGFFMLSISA